MAKTERDGTRIIYQDGSIQISVTCFPGGVSELTIAENDEVRFHGWIDYDELKEFVSKLDEEL